MSRGGTRPGAGRKKTDDARVTLSVRVTPATKRALTQRAASLGVSIGQLIDHLTSL